MEPLEAENGRRAPRPEADEARQEKVRFSIDPEDVAATRAELQEIVRGTPIAEAAVEGFSDWQVIEAMERLWGVAVSDQSDEEPSPSLNETANQMGN